jgi:mRNA-degrading endonuclease RelE of RelBE toxin-antitoxin system
MPRSIQWHEEAWQQLQQLPVQLRREALAIAGALMADPLPPGAETYEPVPGTYRLETGHVTLLYRLVSDEVDIVYVNPNG